MAFFLVIAAFLSGLLTGYGLLRGDILNNRPMHIKGKTYLALELEGFNKQSQKTKGN